MSNLEIIKSKLESQNVPALAQVWSTLAFRPVGWDSVVLSFDSHVKELSQVKVGSAFKLCSGKPVIKYRLIVRADEGRVQFTWKDGVKPAEWLKIEHDLLS